MRCTLLCALAALPASALVTGCGTERVGGTAAHAAEHIRSVTPISATDIACVGVDFPASGERFLYVRRDDHWRCANASDALALDDALDSLVGDLTTATGMSREVPDARLTAYGFTDEAPRVTLFGTDWRAREDRHELQAYALGSELEGRRSYLRIEGLAAVWEVDRRPARRFERADDDRLPPMLDRRLLAGEWPESTGGFTRAFLDFADGRSLELARVGDATTYAWELRRPDSPTLPVLPYRLAGWQSFLYRTPYAGFAAPTEATRVGLDRVWLRITLADAQDTIVLEVAEPQGNRPLAVRNTKNGMLVLLAPEHAALLVPTDGDLLDRSRANRWEAWLGASASGR